MPSLYPIYCYSRYRFTRYFDNGKTCFDCDFLKFHRYNRYILTTGHFIADTDCIKNGLFHCTPLINDLLIQYFGAQPSSGTTCELRTSSSGNLLQYHHRIVKDCPQKKSSTQVQQKERHNKVTVGVVSRTRLFRGNSTHELGYNFLHIRSW